MNAGHDPAWGHPYTDEDAPPEDVDQIEGEDRLAGLLKAGGSFALDTPPTPTPIWGDGHDTLWAEGEALQIAAPQGTGKTTIGQQLTLGRVGLPEFKELLGWPIQAGGGRTLYIASDRPRQAARSLRRMVGSVMRDELDEKLRIWEGPPLVDMAKDVGHLTRLAQAAGADTVIIDSLKDVAIGLTDDEVGARWNRARQTALREGIQLVELHHNRKKPPTAGKRVGLSIDDIYGSTWITSGCGSVLAIDGKPGDSIVTIHHVKQPANDVGPLTVTHDHDTGRTTIWEADDLATIARNTAGGITARDAAAALHDTSKPDRNQVEKARRRLDRLTATGQLAITQLGDRATSTPTKWGTP